MTAVDHGFGPRWLPFSVNTKVIGVLAVRVLGVLALFAFEVVLASSLGVAGYGTFSFLLAIAVLLSRSASLGWLNALTRLVSVYGSSERHDLLKGCVISAYATTALGLCLSAIILIIAVDWFDLLTGYQAFVLVLPMAAALGLLELHRYILRGLGAGDVGEFYPILVLPAVAAGVIWLTAIGDTRIAALVYSSIVAALVLLSALNITRRLPRDAVTARPSFQLKAWTLAALAMLVGSIGAEVSARMGVLVLGGLDMESEAGLFQAASRLALMTIFFLRVLTPVAAPRISVLYAEERWDALRTLYVRQCAMSFAGALPFAGLFWFFPQIVLGLFGAEFESGALILRILAVGYLISAAAGPCGTALMMIGKERIYGVLTIALALLTGIGCYALALRFGGAGAAVATSVGLAVTNALCLFVFYTTIVKKTRAPAGLAGP